MLMRMGEVAAAARQIWKIHQWATDHARRTPAGPHPPGLGQHPPAPGRRRPVPRTLRARGRAARRAPPPRTCRCGTGPSSPTRSALAGSMDAARLRYAQTEELAVELGMTRPAHRHAQQLRVHRVRRPASTNAPRRSPTGSRRSPTSTASSSTRPTSTPSAPSRSTTASTPTPSETLQRGRPPAPNRRAARTPTRWPSTCSPWPGPSASSVRHDRAQASLDASRELCARARPRRRAGPGAPGAGRAARRAG